MYWETFYSVHDELSTEGTLHKILYNCLIWCLLVFLFKSFVHLFMLCFILCLLHSPLWMNAASCHILEIFTSD